MTGMRVMPMTTVSGPASSDEGVVMPWLMWCSGLAESSSPLMTATGPAHTKRDAGPGDVTSGQFPAPSRDHPNYCSHHKHFLFFFFLVGVFYIYI